MVSRSLLLQGLPIAQDTAMITRNVFADRSGFLSLFDRDFLEALSITDSRLACRDRRFLEGFQST